jgi:hypothetical protein
MDTSIEIIYDISKISIDIDEVRRDILDFTPENYI